MGHAKNSIKRGADLYPGCLVGRLICVLLLLLAIASNGIAGISESAPQNAGFAKETYTYKVVGNCKIRADVYRVPDRKIRPVVLFIHGGALMMLDRSYIDQRQLARYIKAGYVVVSIDYRLAPQTKLKGIIEDLQDAHSWLRSRGPDLFQIDPNRIAVIGNSAGGYLTQMAGFSVSPRPKVLVSFYGYGDIAGPWYSRPDPYYNRYPAVPKEEADQAEGGPEISEPSTDSNSKRWRLYLYCRQHGIWPKEVAGIDVNQEQGALDKYCPMRNVDRNYPPTMLLHGDKDTDVPYQLSATMSEELARHDIEHEFITIPNGGHGFDLLGKGLDDPYTAQIFERVIAFIDKHLK